MKDGDLLIQRLRLEQLKFWAQERDSRAKEFLCHCAVLYYRDWEQWIEGTVDRLVTNLDSQSMGVFLSRNIRN